MQDLGQVGYPVEALIAGRLHCERHLRQTNTLSGLGTGPRRCYLLVLIRRPARLV